MGFLVGAACTDIGELLCLADIDDNIVFMNVLTNDLTGIDLILRLDEEAAPILQMIDGIGVGITTLESNKRTIDAAVDVTLVWLIFLETVCDDGFSLTGR